MEKVYDTNAQARVIDGEYLEPFVTNTFTSREEAKNSIEVTLFGGFITSRTATPEDEEWFNKIH